MAQNREESRKRTGKERKGKEVIKGIQISYHVCCATAAFIVMSYIPHTRTQALLELEDLEFSFKGSAELAAALSATIYTEHPNLLAKAESEWRLVEAFDARYNDLTWVR
eukprot:scaffold101032_cov36-Prasinocladus_malaysianus.AAC.1